MYANYLAAVGRVEDAVDECRYALSLDPVSLAINTDLAIVLYFARDYDAAARQLRATLHLDDRYAPAHAILGWVYTQSHNHAEALAAGTTALALDDAPWIVASIGCTHALAGDREAARGMVDALNERRRADYVCPYDIAVLHASLGDRGQALDHLRQAYEERSGVLVWGLLNDPMLDPLRSDPAFAAVRQEVGLLADLS